MYVKIGPYRHGLSTYALHEWLVEKFKVSEEMADKIIYPLSLCCRFYNRFFFKEERKIKVRIDPYDFWNMDHTLAHIITPLLKELKEKKHGVPFVDNVDVPEELWSPDDSDYAVSGATDKNFEARWEYVLSEMIWAFENVNSDWEQAYGFGEMDFHFIKSPNSGYSTMTTGDHHTSFTDRHGMQKHEERMTKGFILFGKYFRALWD
jgi:hypothetical protein